VPAIISPVMVITTLTPALPASDWCGLILTSEHGAQAVARLGLPAGLPVFCVGAQTAAAAIRAGLAAQVAGADADALVARLLELRPPGPLLHLRGEHARGDIATRLTAAGLPTKEAVVYRQAALPLTAPARALLSADTAVVLPLFSPRSAEILAAQGPFAARLHAVAMSPAVARAAGTLGCTTLVTASAPDGPAMCHAVAALLDQLLAP
jgi:uroporphyrinogen-III synthase